MGTRRLLVLQLGGLVALAALASAALFGAYHDTHRRPGDVRDRTAPAVLEVAAARSALMSAHLAARTHLSSSLTDETSTDETYRTQIGAATQSLSQIADRQVAGEAGKHTLSTVNALLVVYQEAIALAVRHAERSDLREAWFHSADTILNRGESGILSRLDELQDDQLDRLVEQTAFTGPRWTAWRLAAAALLVLAVALVVVQWQLNRRFPQRLNPCLLAACLILLAAVLPVGWAQETQRRLDAARAELTSAAERHRGVRADSVLEKKGLERMRVNTAETLDKVTRELDRTAARQDGIAVIPAGGAAVAVLSWIGLQRHLGQYRFRS
ncbi:MAG TPA: hypothetical protein VE546_25805 [Streptomyces sp.]|uniref:hypothetical protein n=1 Tax=Streptomyces sp. TaxID=1931 RepID=UPI002D6DD1F6|nr:hypothetical protein [Streptomyces sp.]HZG06939.1 hypothetical protein [Streptomyces sp.]